MKLPSVVCARAGPIAVCLGLALSIGSPGCKDLPVKDGYFSCDPDESNNCPSGMTCAWSEQHNEYRCFLHAPGDAGFPDGGVDGGPKCGNGTIDQGEQCDGQDLGGQTCQGLGHPGGQLACTTVCSYDRAGCDPVVTCGDGNIDRPAEECDGVDLGGATCESLGFTEGTLSCLANCTYDVSQCTLILVPTITGIDGTGAASAIAPRPEDQAAYDNTPNRVDGTRRVDSETRQLVITGTNLQNPVSVTVEGQAGQGTVDLEIIPGGTDTMLTVRFPQVMNVTSAGLFLLTLVTSGGQAQAQVFFLQGQDGPAGQDGQDGVCDCINFPGDVNIGGKLTVQGGVDLGACPSGYERDPAADPSIIVCAHPVSGDEMVKVGDFWVDRYEAAVFPNADCTGQPVGSTGNDWDVLAPDFPYNGHWSAKYYACSVPGVLPSRWITGFQAEAACAAQGKHVITNAEWQAAVEGTVDPGAYDGGAGGPCNTDYPGSVPRASGNAGTLPADPSSCISAWGAEDMIGNAKEMTAWDLQKGTVTGTSLTAAWGDDYYNLVDRAGSGGNPFPPVPVRGGDWYEGTGAGAFYIDMGLSPGYVRESVGFRCARTR